MYIYNIYECEIFFPARARKLEVSTEFLLFFCFLFSFQLVIHYSPSLFSLKFIREVEGIEIFSHFFSLIFKKKKFVNHSAFVFSSSQLEIGVFFWSLRARARRSVRSCARASVRQRACVSYATTTM